MTKLLALSVLLLSICACNSNMTDPSDIDVYVQSVNFSNDAHSSNIVVTTLNTHNPHEVTFTLCDGNWNNHPPVWPGLKAELTVSFEKDNGCLDIINVDKIP
jgi:hypothetical protein